jgi:hypothetical protein
MDRAPLVGNVERARNTCRGDDLLQPGIVASHPLVGLLYEVTQDSFCLWVPLDAIPSAGHFLIGVKRTVMFHLDLLSPADADRLS